MSEGVIFFERLSWDREADIRSNTPSLAKGVPAREHRDQQKNERRNEPSRRHTRVPAYAWKYTDAWNQSHRAEVSCVDQHDDRDNDLIHFDHEAETCQSTEASADEDTCDCDCYVTHSSRSIGSADKIKIRRG